MIRHYLTMTFRTINRAKGYFLINLAGLTAGLTCTLLIFLWVRDELRMDKFHAKDARLFQVMEFQSYADNIMTTTSTPGLLAETLKAEIPEIEYAATTTWIDPNTLSVDEKNVKAKGYHVGSDYFNILSFPLLQGNPDDVLADKYSIVISEDLAIRLFGSAEDVIGKTVVVQHDEAFRVSGVFGGTPANSSLQFDFVLNFEQFKDDNQWVTYWGNNGPGTLVILREGSSPDDVTAKIKDFVKFREEQSNVELFLKPFSERYLHGKYVNGKPAGGRIEYVRLFSVIAIFILLIACINFMNLATARASRKAKEVGIKKSVGAPRSSLVVQFMSESILTAFLALLIALLAVYLFLPEFNRITDKRMVFDLLDPELMGWSALVVVLTGLLAGSYPALYLSRFRPAVVLKGEVKGSWEELLARRGLVVFQFLLAVVLIVSVLVIYRQIDFVQSKNLGYEKDNLIRFPIEGRLDSTRETFLDELRRIPGVIAASGLGHSLIGRNNNTSGLDWEGKDPEVRILFENMAVDYETLETLGVEVIEGRGYSREFVADTSKIVFNEAGIRAMGLADPIGKTIRLWDEYDLQIIGVVKDFHFQSLHDAVNPLFFRLSPRNTWNVMVRIDGSSVKETLERISNFYAEYNPGFTLEHTFLDDEYARQYAAEQRVASLSWYFSGLAILISCLGLFGLAAFTAERRQKEIGIRKAMGASSPGIVLLLSGDFTRMVLISILVGLPLSYWLLGRWLERFAFHIELEAWFFIAAGGVALIIAWITVASQAFRAARVNPVDCLRDE
jgi:predicted permease